MTIISREFALPVGTFQAGVREFGPVALPDNISTAIVEIARRTTGDLSVFSDAGTRVQVDIECSTDGGASWFYCGGGGTFGGVFVGLGGEFPVTRIKVPFPRLPGRLVRGRFTCIGGTVRSSVLIELHNPTFDNVNSTQGTAVANLTTGAWTIAGSDRLLVAGLGWADGSPPTYSAIKWGGSGGTTLTQVGSTLSAGSFHRVAMARLIAPTAASQTLYGEVSGTTGELCVGGVSFTGVEQTTPLGTASTNTGSGSGTNFTATVDVTSASDEVVIDVAYAGTTSGGNGSCTVAVGAGQTMRWEQENISNFSAGTQSTEPGAGTVTMSEAFTFGITDAYAWGIIGVGIKPAAGGGGGGGGPTIPNQFKRSYRPRPFGPGLAR